MSFQGILSHNISRTYINTLVSLPQGKFASHHVGTINGTKLKDKKMGRPLVAYVSCEVS
jgi:hypothetical protein